MMADLSPAGALVREHDPDRYLCALFAAPEKREALFAVLAFNHEVAKTRDVVSEPMLGQIRLQWWREAIDGIVAGTPRRHEVVLPLADAFETFVLARAPFDRILDARVADLEDAPFDRIEDLADYTAATAGALSRILLDILRVEDMAVLAASDAASTAWALTGLLRSLPFHARAKRLMLPKQVLEQHGTRIGDYHELRDVPALRAAVRAIAARASEAICLVEGPSRALFQAGAPVLLQARLARLYLDRLERAGFNAFDPAVNAEMPLKSWALWWASMRGRV
jgi:NADH dehydrogenase [ubiquinone] 1 alpha subcomplex assembly factor 6